MADLDYAYLADYAAVQDGKLTAVGASFTHVAAPMLPAARPIAIAGRIRATPDELPLDARFTISGPDGVFRFALGTPLDVEPGVPLRPYGPANDHIGILFAINVQLPLPVVGLYQVTVEVGGQVERSLKFDVEIA